MVPAFLKDIIMRADEQKISYAAFMNEVLYHPQFGYYRKEREKVGTQGDFLTSSNVHTIYGKLFAKLFMNYLKETSLAPCICEIGGGTGRFAKQLLKELKKLDAAFYQTVSYHMVETSPYHLRKQKEAIPIDANVYFHSSLEELPKANFEGILFSNELFDALPVHVIENKDGFLYEVFVTVNGEDRLEEVFSPLINATISEYIKEFNIQLKNGQRLEIPLAMVEYSQKIAELLSKGSIVTVDYGYTFAELALNEHSRGSLRGYFQHQMVSTPLLYPSEMDLTSHIHLNALEALLEKEGCMHICTKRQGNFLVAAGILDYLQENMDANPFSEKSKQNRAIRSLILDNSWSNSFHVMIHEKNTDGWGRLLAN